MSPAAFAAIIALAISGQPAAKWPQIRCHVREETPLGLALDGSGAWVPAGEPVITRTCGRSYALRRGLRRRP